MDSSHYYNLFIYYDQYYVFYLVNDLILHDWNSLYEECSILQANMRSFGLIINDESEGLRIFIIV